MLLSSLIATTALTHTDTAQIRVHVTRKVNVGTVIAKPRTYDQDRKKHWPLLVFLHGSGERGTDLAKVRIHGPLHHYDEGTDYPFIIAAPQCPDNTWWDWNVLSGWLDQVLKKFRVNPDQIYLTGLSMGGYGTWEWGAREASRFAALIPICGGGSRIGTLPLSGMPIWCVHGTDDPVVPISESLSMVERAQRAGAIVKMSSVPGEGHGVWINFYKNEDWVNWLLQHKLSDRKR